MTRTAPLTLAALVLLATACGGQPAVELDVAPAGTVEEVAPEPLDEVGTDATAPAEEAGASDGTVEEAAPTPERRSESPATSSTSTGSSTGASTGASAEPAPLPADPELVVGEDGCVTDVATGLVVTCHDPAAGPDDES